MENVVLLPHTIGLLYQLQKMLKIIGLVFWGIWEDTTTGGDPWIIYDLASCYESIVINTAKIGSITNVVELG